MCCKGTGTPKHLAAATAWHLIVSCRTDGLIVGLVSIVVSSFVTYTPIRKTVNTMWIRPYMMASNICAMLSNDGVEETARKCKLFCD